MARKLEDMEPDAVELATALALLGHPLPIHAVHRLSDAKDPRRLVHSLEQVGLARRIPFRGNEGLEIVHDSLSQAIRDSTGPDTAVRLHGHLAEKLDDVAEVAREVVAEHWEKGGYPDKARALLLVAARDSVDALAFDHAVQCLKHALDLTIESQKFEPMRDLAQALALGGRADEAARRFEEAAGLCDGAKRQKMMEQAAIHFLLASEADAGLKLVHELFDSLGIHLPRRRVALLAHLAYQRFRKRWRGLKYQLTENGIEPHATVADLAYAISTCLSQLDLSLGAYVQHLHFVHGLRSGSPLRVARALAVEAGFLVSAGQSESVARELLEQAHTVMGQRDEPRVRALFSIARAVIAWATGRWRECAEAMQQAEQIAEHECVGAWWELNISRSLRQDALRWSGRYHELRPLTERYLVDAERRNDRFGTVMFQRRFASTLFLLDDRPGDARRSCDTSGTYPQSAGSEWQSEDVHLQHLAQFHARAEYLLYMGREDEALAFAKERFRQMRWAPLLMATPPRIKVFHQLATCRLAVAARCQGRQRKKLVRAARADNRTVRSAEWGYACFLADLLAATADHLDGMDVDERLADLQRRAGELDMTQYAASIGLVRARDSRERQSSESQVRQLGVANPVRWSAVLLPGLITVEPKDA